MSSGKPEFESDPNMYLGWRDETKKDSFKILIKDLLAKGKLKEKYIELLTNEKSMEEYGKAFTAESETYPENNYERYEQIGDVAAGHFIISYSYRRFPQLDCTAGVKVASRLRINYGAKKSFSDIADKLGFWQFITCPIDCPIETKEEKKKGKEVNRKCRSRHRKDLLEDVFEAFLGCTEFLLDNAFRYGIGYAIVYDILSNIFDKIPISLEYEDLIDAKTRLKETFDLPEFKRELGNIIYINTGGVSTEASTHSPHVCEIYRAPPGVSISIPQLDPEQPIPKFPWYKRGNKYYNTYWVLISWDSASSKSESEQNAAEKAIKILKDGVMIGYNIRDIQTHNVTSGVIKKYFKKPPPEYEFFCRK